MSGEDLVELPDKLTQLDARRRREGERDDTATVLTLDGRRREGLVDMPQIGEAKGLTLRRIDQQAGEVLQ